MSSTSQASIDQFSAWPISKETAILTSVMDVNNPDNNITNDFLEPSGLTIYWDDNNVGWFYLASDNGKIARRRLDRSDDWVIQSFYDAAHPSYSDFESICVAKGKLMVGIEGGAKDGDPNHACIKRLTPITDQDDSVGQFSTSFWVLSDVTLSKGSGMEAMTFVPDGHYPASWLPPSQHGQSLYYGGVFLVAFQSVPGQIYVYDLPEGNNQTHHISFAHYFTSGLQPDRKLSDLYFDASSDTLYALYDDSANLTDILQELTLDDAGATLQYQTNPPYYGCEAATVNGDRLYLGIDQNSAQWTNNGGSGALTNYVYEYNDYTDHAS
jgi:hypothetical protein